MTTTKSGAKRKTAKKQTQPKAPATPVVEAEVEVVEAVSPPAPSNDQVVSLKDIDVAEIWEMQGTFPVQAVEVYKTVDYKYGKKNPRNPQSKWQGYHVRASENGTALSTTNIGKSHPINAAALRRAEIEFGVKFFEISENDAGAKMYKLMTPVEFGLDNGNIIVA